MYRQYREGELPDIQIKNSELIRPLQALAQVSVSVRFSFVCLSCCFSTAQQRDSSTPVQKLVQCSVERVESNIAQRSNEGVA